MVIFKNAGNSRRHQGLPESNHVTNEHTTSFVEMVCRNLDCCDLKFEQCVAKIAWYAKVGQTSPRFLRQVIGNLELDVVRGECLLACPALLKDI